MSYGDVIVETEELFFSVTDGDDRTVASFSVDIPSRILKVVQDDPDEMDDPFATEQVNACQIRWNEKDKKVEVFTDTFGSSNLLMLQLDYPTFFKEFRKWHKAMVKKYKEKK